MLEHDCTLVILACNTASAKALRTIQQHDLPNLQSPISNLQSRKVNVLGVIRPTVEVVPSITRTGHIGVLATPATVSSESYVLELEKISNSPKDGLVISQQPCPLWVPLIEAGEHDKPGSDYFVDLYLRQLLSQDSQIDTVVLGCTHYPLLLPKISQWLNNPKNAQMVSGRKVNVIAQGELVANSLADYLNRHPEYRDQLTTNGLCDYLTTENADRFSQSASVFCSAPISAKHINL